MFARHEDYEMAAFLFFIVVFGAWEFFRPAYPLNRRKELALDLVSIIALVLASKASRVFIARTMGTAFVMEFAHSLTMFDSWPSILRVIVSVCCADFLIYLIHRALHHPWLWRAHTWHHSITEIYWLSGFRASFIHTFLYLLPQLVLAQAVFHLHFWENVAAFSAGAFAQIWTHTSVKASPRWLEWVIVTPKYHRVHHSREIQNKNFGGLLTFWDRLFNTIHSTKGLPDGMPTGLGDPVTSLSHRTRMIVGI